MPPASGRWPQLGNATGTSVIYLVRMRRIRWCGALMVACALVGSPKLSGSRSSGTSPAWRTIQDGQGAGGRGAAAQAQLPPVDTSALRTVQRGQTVLLGTFHWDIESDKQLQVDMSVVDVWWE